MEVTGINQVQKQTSQREGRIGLDLLQRVNGCIDEAGIIQMGVLEEQTVEQRIIELRCHHRLAFNSLVEGISGLERGELNGRLAEICSCIQSLRDSAEDIEGELKGAVLVNPNDVDIGGQVEEAAKDLTNRLDQILRVQK